MFKASRPAVSLCMMVRDEEHNLAACLSPVAPLFDQIVIVDTGSRDRTCHIARRFTPHVYDFPWCDDFSAGRNEALRHATGDWIMWLDADDRLRPENVARLGTLFAGLADRPRAYLMDTVCLAAPGEEASIVTHPRLFRRHPQLHWRGRVHEQLEPEPIDLGYEWVTSDVQIDHWGYVDRAVSARKRLRKLRLLAMDYAVDPENCSTLLHLGLSQLGTGNIGQARRHLLHLAETPRSSPPLLRCIFSVLANLCTREGDFAGAVQFADRGLAFMPGDHHFLYAKAHACFALRDFAAAEEALQQILASRAKVHMHFGETANIQSKLAPHLLAAIYFTKGELSRAEAAYTALVRDFPDHAGTWYNLGLIYIATGEQRKLQWVLESISRCAAGGLDAELLLARWRLKQGELIAAGALIDQLLDQAPQSVFARLLRVEWLAHSYAPLAAQIDAVRTVLQLDPANVQARAWMGELEQAQRSIPAPPPVESWSSSIAFSGGMAIQA